MEEYRARCACCGTEIEELARQEWCNGCCVRLKELAMRGAR
jgi:hypothetical protein